MDSTGTGGLESAESDGLDGTGLEMLAARTDINGVSTKQEASLQSLGITLVASNATFMMAGNTDVASMIAEDSGMASLMAGDFGVVSMMAGDSGMAWHP